MHGWDKVYKVANPDAEELKQICSLLNADDISD